MELNFEYLKDLEYPEMAITEKLWNMWRYELLNKPDIQNTLSKKCDEVCFKIGVYWKTLTAPVVRDILRMPFIELMDHNKSGKRSIVLMIARLHEVNDEIIENNNFITDISEGELEERMILLNKCRIDINKTLDEGRGNVTEENSDEVIKHVIKAFIRNIFISADYKTKNKKFYIDVFWNRVVENMTFEEIAAKLDTSASMINSIMQRFLIDFRKIFITERQFARFCKKFEDFYYTYFDEVTKPFKYQMNGKSIELYGLTPKGKIRPYHDDELYEQRNKKLLPLQLFQQYFIGDMFEFAAWVNKAEHFINKPLTNEIASEEEEENA